MSRLKSYFLLGLLIGALIWILSRNGYEKPCSHYAYEHRGIIYLATFNAWNDEKILGHEWYGGWCETFDSPSISPDGSELVFLTRRKECSAPKFDGNSLTIYDLGSRQKSEVFKAGKGEDEGIASPVWM